MTAAIEIIDVYKTIRDGFWARKIELLKGISLEVEAGTVFGFVGPNGAGKSTTIKHIIGASKPTKGSIRVAGGSPYSVETRKAIGYLPELPRLPETSTPRELLRLHATLARVPSAEAAKRTEELLDRVNLLHRADDRVKGFSKGMQQRVGVALALVGRPKVLVMDEPMTGLDPVGRRLVRDVIAGEKERGTTVFFSSHVLPDVEALCDNIGVIVDGEMRSSGSLDAILNRMTHGFEIVVEGDAPPSADIGQVDKRGEAWVVQLPADHDAIAVAANLSADGYKVRSVETLKAHLEDILVDVIEKDESAKRASAKGGAA